MTHDEMIAVIAAHRDGKMIQFSGKDCRESQNRIWLEAKNPVWDFDCLDYRVKPEPIVAWVIVNASGKVLGACYANIDHAESVAINIKGSRIVRLVEEGGEA